MANAMGMAKDLISGVEMTRWASRLLFYEAMLGLGFALVNLVTIPFARDRATKTILCGESSGHDGYERYFGENGALTRRRRERPHPITGVKEVLECQLVEVWPEDDKILHR